MTHMEKAAIVDIIKEALEGYFEDIDMPMAISNAHHMSQQALLRKSFQIADIVEDIYNQESMRQVQEDEDE